MVLVTEVRDWLKLSSIKCLILPREIFLGSENFSWISNSKFFCAYIVQFILGVFNVYGTSLKDKLKGLDRSTTLIEVGILIVKRPCWLALPLNFTSYSDLYVLFTIVVLYPLLKIPVIPETIPVKEGLGNFWPLMVRTAIANIRKNFINIS